MEKCLLKFYLLFMLTLLEKMSTCQNNPEKSSTSKIDEHTPSGYSLFTHCSFDKTKNKLDCYRGKYCMERFCKDLKEHATKIINYDTKKMMPLTSKERKVHRQQKKMSYIQKRVSTDNDNKKSHKIRDHCHHTGKYRGDAHDICNLKCKISKETPVIFHNVSVYDYHFTINELAKEFKGQFERLGDNTEKYTTFSVPTNKVLNIGKSIKCKKGLLKGLMFIRKI